MASGPITSQQIDGETVETVADFILGGCKITADGDCSPEIKRCLLLGIKVMTNLDSILKCRDITLPTNVHLVKAMVFPVIMYGCDSWTVKEAELRRIDSFELWFWRRLLRVPWTAMRSNQSIPKEISPGCSLEGLMLKLKLQYFGHLMWRAGSFENTLMLGKIEGRRRRGWQRMRWLDDTTDSMDMGLGGLQELVMDREACHAAAHGVTKSQTRLSDWTELNWSVSHQALSVHVIFQARILEWVAISYSRVASQPRDQIPVSWVSCINRWIFTTTTTWNLTIVRDVLRMDYMPGFVLGTMNSPMKKKMTPELLPLLGDRQYSQTYGFSSSHVWIWDLDFKESWVLKNWCFWTMVLEKTLESPLDHKEILPVNPKGNQSWIFIGRTDSELKAQYFGHLMCRTDSLEKTLMLGKTEGRRRRGRQRIRRWLDGITDSLAMSLSKFW